MSLYSASSLDWAWTYIWPIGCLFLMLAVFLAALPATTTERTNSILASNLASIIDSSATGKSHKWTDFGAVLSIPTTKFW